MATMMLSVAIPAMNVPVYKAGTMEPPVWMMTDYAMLHQPEETSAADEPIIADTGISENAVPAMEAAHTVSEETSAVSIAGTGMFLRKHGNRIIGLIYLVLVLASLSLTAYNCVRIRALRRRSKLTYTKEYTLAEHEDTTTPFSFLRTIFMGFNYESHEREQILIHEARVT